MTHPVRSFVFESAARTHVGNVRRRNEDRYHADPRLGIFAVADGMGGHDAGDLASAAVVEELASVGRAVSADDLLNRTHERLIRAHQSLLALARERGSGIIGATVAALLVHGGFYALLWSGDSRIYLARGGTIRQVTRDHSEVEALVERGVLTRAEASGWRGRNAITRAVGVHETLEVEVVDGTLAPGDVFVLCSDGLSDGVTADEICSIVTAAAPEEAADRLVDLALARGGHDNITVVVVRCRERPEGDRTVIQGGAFR
jgi:protein phosphatase